MMSLKDFQMEPLDEIEREINYDFDFEETCDPKNPIRGRIIIGNANNKPLIDLHTHDWKIVVLEIGLEYIGNDEDYEWYWEITCRDIKETKCIVKSITQVSQLHMSPVVKDVLAYLLIGLLMVLRLMSSQNSYYRT